MKAATRYEGCPLPRLTTAFHAHVEDVAELACLAVGEFEGAGARPTVVPRAEEPSDDATLAAMAASGDHAHLGETGPEPDVRTFLRLD